MANRAPEGALGNVQSLAGKEPSCDCNDRSDEQQKAHGIAVRRGALIHRHDWHGQVNGVQRNGRGYHDHRQYGDDDGRANGRTREGVRAGRGHEHLLGETQRSKWTFCAPRFYLLRGQARQKSV